MPSNLQGLWNEHIAAPWNCDYHININVQMNYWPANMTGLDELNLPLFDYIDRVVESGKPVVIPRVSQEPMLLNRAGSNMAVRVP